MTIYFLSRTPAALKLDGEYVGIIDLFERRVETEGGNILAEIVPDGNAQPLNFFINEKFFCNPPDFADVYRMEGDALIRVRGFAKKPSAPRVLAQTRFCGNLVTLFECGGLQLSCEGAGAELYAMEPAFYNASFEESAVGGYPVLLVRGERRVCVLSDKGKRVFCHAAEQCFCGETLKITERYETCAQIVCESEFTYDGESFRQKDSRARETAPVPPECLPFAFFESVLACAECGKYLCDGLKPRAGELGGFLGGFCGVTVPTEKFYRRHGNLKAAGLVYEKKSNLFDVKYFALEADGTEITNIYPVDERDVCGEKKKGGNPRLPP